MFKYGVGSCGPRAFYGTVDVHLDLETQVSNFIGCEESALYSYGFATAASAIPAYAKRGDIIFADKSMSTITVFACTSVVFTLDCNFAIQKGLQASRSKTEWFEHNNMDDLERLLRIQEEKERKVAAVGREPMATFVFRIQKRRKRSKNSLLSKVFTQKALKFAPCRVLSSSNGNTKCAFLLTNLFRLAFSALQAAVRIDRIDERLIWCRFIGLTEHFDVKVEDIDLIIVSLEKAIASTGGLCCGRSYVIGHQRLAGANYECKQCTSLLICFQVLATVFRRRCRLCSQQPLARRST